MIYYRTKMNYIFDPYCRLFHIGIRFKDGSVQYIGPLGRRTSKIEEALKFHENNTSGIIEAVEDVKKNILEPNMKYFINDRIPPTDSRDWFGAAVFISNTVTRDDKEYCDNEWKMLINSRIRYLRIREDKLEITEDERKELKKLQKYC